MISTRTMARRAGALYFVHMLVALYSEFVQPSFVVAGDPAATAARIVANQTAYRFGVLLAVVALLLLVFVAASLYRLLRDVDPSQAVLMMALVSIGVAVALDNLLARLAPPVLLQADFLSVFSRPQLEALALGVLRYRGSGSAVSLAFWGLWLFPFGQLVMRSRFLPRSLGLLLMVAGSAYLVTSATAILVPEHRSLVTRLAMPFYFGEVPIIFWLLIKGAREPRAEAASLHAA